MGDDRARERGDRGGQPGRGQGGRDPAERRVRRPGDAPRRGTGPSLRASAAVEGVPAGGGRLRGRGRPSGRLLRGARHRAADRHPGGGGGHRRLRGRARLRGAPGLRPPAAHDRGEPQAPRRARLGTRRRPLPPQRGRRGEDPTGPRRLGTRRRRRGGMDRLRGGGCRSPGRGRGDRRRPRLPPPRAGPRLGGRRLLPGPSRRPAAYASGWASASNPSAEPAGSRRCGSPTGPSSRPGWRWWA